MQMQEAADEALVGWMNSDSLDTSDVQAILESFAEDFRSIGEELAESAQNMEEGFGHPTGQSEELQERADNIESQADDIESTDLPEFDEEAPSEEDYDMDDEESEAEYVDTLERWESARDEWRNEIESAAQDAIGNAEIY